MVDIDERKLFEERVANNWFGEPLPKTNELVVFTLKREKFKGYCDTKIRTAYKAWIARSEVK